MFRDASDVPGVNHHFIEYLTSQMPAYPGPHPGYPTRRDLPSIPGISSLHQASTRIDEEAAHRDRMADAADIGFWTAGITTIAAGPLGAMQNELQTRPGVGGHDIWTRISEAPLDVRALGVAAGAVALLTAATFIRRGINSVQEARATRSAIVNSDGAIVNLESQATKRGLWGNLGRGALILAGGFAAYKMGEHLSAAKDIAASAGLLSLGLLAKFVTRRRARRDNDRHLTAVATEAEVLLPDPTL